MKIAVGDQVRVHFHPPYPMQSFCEGVVSHAGPESEQTPEAETKSEEIPVDVKPQPANEQRGLLSTLFGRKK